jgi:hypothetical protein
MSLTNTVKKETAGEDLDRYEAVTLNGSGEVVKATANDDVVYGVTRTSASSGETISVVRDGFARVKIDGSSTAVGKGDDLMPGAAGKLISHTANSGHTYAAQLQRVDEGDLDGEIAEVRLYSNRSRAA